MPRKEIKGKDLIAVDGYELFVDGKKHIFIPVPKGLFLRFVAFFSGAGCSYVHCVDCDRRYCIVHAEWVGS